MKLVDPTLIRTNAKDQPIRIGIALYRTDHEHHHNSPLQWAITTDTSDHFESLDRRFYRYSNLNRGGMITPDSADVPRKEGWHLMNIIHVANTNQERHLLDTFFCSSPLLVSPRVAALSLDAAFRVQDDRDGNTVNEDWVVSALLRLHLRSGGTFSLPFEPQDFYHRICECVTYLEKHSGAEDIPPVYRLSNMRRYGDGSDGRDVN